MTRLEAIVRVAGMLLCIVLAGVATYCQADGARGSAMVIILADAWITVTLVGPVASWRTRPTKEVAPWAPRDPHGRAFRTTSGMRLRLTSGPGLRVVRRTKKSLQNMA